MDKFRIIGCHCLKGEIAISGAKNAALPIMCASLLSNNPIKLTNIPNLHDVNTMIFLLQEMGVKVTRYNNASIILNSSSINNLVAPYELVKTMRASILLLGPLLSRFGYVRISLPGGCTIGARPIDQHVKALQAMGASINVDDDCITAHASSLKGAMVKTDVVTVTGTENILMAATIAKGETIIENASCEPEVNNLAKLLVSMGASIKGIGTNKLIVKGVKYLHGAEHQIIPDRIEAGTFLCALAAVGGELVLRDVIPSHLNAVIRKLYAAGVSIKIGKNWVYAKMNCRPLAIDLYTSVFPGFPTDMQAQFLALACIAHGKSKIIENIFENRLMHINALNQLGANISANNNIVLVDGVKNLFGTNVTATDLRGCASLVIAGLAAQGETIIDHIYHIDRGYEQIETKLSEVGAKIYRIS